MSAGHHAILRPLAIFLVTTLLTLGLMLAANILVLPVAFDTQGTGWTAAPVRSMLVTLGFLLQSPLDAIYAMAGSRSVFGLVSIGALSIVYGALAAGLWVLVRRKKARRQMHPR